VRSVFCLPITVTKLRSRIGDRGGGNSCLRSVVWCAINPGHEKATFTTLSLVYLLPSRVIAGC